MSSMIHIIKFSFESDALFFCHGPMSFVSYPPRRGGPDALLDSPRNTMHLNFMVRPRCPIMHQFSHKACANVKNGQLKVIKSALSLSQRRVHNVIFEVGVHFQSLTTTFSHLALDCTLPRSSSTPLQMMRVRTPPPSLYRRSPLP